MDAAQDRALELIALRQSRRRRFNERLAALQGDDVDPDATLFRCECGLIGCAASINVSGGEYARVRRDPDRFVVLAAHVIPEADAVVETGRGWAMVEKPVGIGRTAAVRTAPDGGTAARARFDHTT